MLPQLDLSTYISQAFWLIVCFCLLWILMSVFITPKLANIIEQRKRKINEYIRKAEKLNNQAKEALKNYHDTLAKAEHEADAEIERERENLREYLKTTEDKMSAQLNKKIADNEFDLAKEKKHTLLQIESISENLAYEIVQKLGFTSISRKDISSITQKDKVNG